MSADEQEKYKALVDNVQREAKAGIVLLLTFSIINIHIIVIRNIIPNTNIMHYNPCNGHHTPHTSYIIVFILTLAPSSLHPP
ncbi:hypothetical protein EON63_23160, partial [archaeon]